MDDVEALVMNEGADLRDMARIPTDKRGAELMAWFRRHIGRNPTVRELDVLWVACQAQGVGV